MLIFKYIFLKVNKDYILWALISIPILAGVFLIVRQFIMVAGHSGIKNEKNSIEKRLSNPPDIIKAVYFTSTTADNTKSVGHLIEVAGKSGLNAVVIDIKDYSGYVAYDSGASQTEKYKTKRVSIKDIDGLIKRLHDNNIYAIARITVFEDSVLTKARSDWAVKDKYTGGIWHDRNGLAWLNPAASGSWDYIVDVAQDAAERGFDELNFDYIRFPSDGDMTALVFPGWPARRSLGEGGDGKKTKAEIIGEFYKYLRQKLPGIRLSADMFGFVTTHTDDLGIGQLMENAFAAFDYVAPMVYPSHYPPNYMGFPNPAEHPYEVVNFSMKGGMERLKAYKLAHPDNKTQFRPWLQDFNLGADYTLEMVTAQIKATQDALGDGYGGFMLWNARNVYHESVFK